MRSCEGQLRLEPYLGGRIGRGSTLVIHPLVAERNYSWPVSVYSVKPQRGIDTYCYWPAGTHLIPAQSMCWRTERKGLLKELAELSWFENSLNLGWTGCADEYPLAYES